MELRNIKTNKCPVCGCTDVVMESVEYFESKKVGNYIKVHGNGGRWEHRKFLCGMGVKYDPCFRSEVLYGNCMNDPEYLALLKKREEDEKRLISLLEDNNIDEHIVSKVKKYVL